MSAVLQIQNPGERMIVRAADVLLAPLGWMSRRSARPIERILLLRLERIGDLLMTLEAIADVRTRWPNAVIDIAVGSWNRDLAAMIPAISAVHLADVPWLSRGERPTSWAMLLAASRRWRANHYDLVINFEPDIRSNLLAWRTGAPVRAGYWTGGGGPLLTVAEAYDPTAHVAINAQRLVARVAGTVPSLETSRIPRLQVGDQAHVAPPLDAAIGPRPWIGIHPSGGRESKQWHLDRFAAVARRLATMTGGTVVITGGPADRPLVDAVLRQLDDVRAVPMAIDSLPSLAELLSALDVFVTGDTGPMHLAAAVDTPVVALFGPSDPARYGPRASIERILRVDLPCSPCGLVRLPPERCRGHVPDCMDGISVDAVVSNTLDVLTATSARRRTAGAR